MTEPDLPPPQITVRLLNGFDITLHSQLPMAIQSQRTQSLFAYLILHNQIDISRKALAFLLWPESSEAQALTNLRKHLMNLKDSLKSFLPDVDHYLVAERHIIRWNPPEFFKCDIDTFRSFLASGKENRSARIDNLRNAIQLYKGELLPGCYDEWMLPLREQLQQQYLAALEQLSSLLEEQRGYSEAIQYCTQILQVDSLHEATYRRLIRLYALKEDRAAALRTYHTFVTLLREELGIDPDEETQTTYERLLNGASLPVGQPELAAYAPFVGREQEWQRLQNCWKLALSGVPQFVLIAGEAGIGKTRLAEELLNWANHQGFFTVRSRCYAAEGRLTYAPIIEWLRSDRIRPQRSRIANTWLTELARLLPEILSEHPELPPPEPITQSAQRHHLFEAATRALLASAQPLLLLIDDLQWCDKETLELLHFLLRNAPNLSQTNLLLIGTARLPDEVDSNHALYELLNPLKASESLTQIDLKRLTEIETSNLATQMATQRLDAQSLNQLFVDTAGNPLFVVETMRAMQPHPNPPQTREGTMNGMTIIPPLVVGRLGESESDEILKHLPPKVLTVIQWRLSHLSAAAQELCQWAAIIGRSFTLDLLVSASKIAQDKAVNALDELWQRRIIREQSNDAYDFSHDRIRDVAAAGVSRVRRKYLHKCVAEALERQNTNQLDNLAAQIASHFEAAGMVEKAVQYFEKAARHTQSIYALKPTIILLEHGMSLLKTLEERQERDVLELKLLNRLTIVLAGATGYVATSMMDAIERAYTLSKKLHVSPSPILMRMLAIYRLGIKTYDQVQELAATILELAQSSTEKPDSVLLVEGQYAHGVNTFWHGDFPASKKHLQSAIEHYSIENHKRHIVEYANDTGSYCCVRLGLTLWYLGYPDQALRECEVGIQSIRKIKDPNTMVNNLAHVIWLQCERRSLSDISKVLEEFASQSVHVPTTRRDGFLFLEGWCHYQCGRYQSAIQLLADYVIVRDLRRADSVYRNLAFVLLARAYGAISDFENAHAALTEGEAFYDGQDDWWNKAEFYRIKGDLLVAQGKQIAQAETCFQQALEISRRQQAKSLELRAAMSMARLWDQQGKRKEARELLTGIYNWFSEGFDTADLQDAKALLSSLQ